MNEDNERSSQEPAPSNKLPKGSYFCLCQIVLSSFGLLGTRAVMPLYLRNKLGYTNNEATAVVHGMDLMKFFTPIGAIIADSFWNRYWIVVVTLILATIARIIQFLGAIPMIAPKMEIARIYTYCFYFFLGIAMVGLESAVMSFRGDQFKLPEQNAAFKKYVHLQYYLHNMSITFGYLLTPLLKSEIHCLGQQDCYSASFALSTIFSALSATIFATGKKYYRIRKPTGNMIVLVSKCIFEALRTRYKNPNPRQVQHWLDHAEPIYGSQLVSDIKRLFSLIKLYTTIPIFFSLYTQYMTKWLFQASRMNGRVGSYTIVPDHYQLLNPIIILIVMPLTIKFIDPRLKKWHMDRSLRRMTLGGFLTALAFIVAAVLETELMKNAPKPIEEGLGQIRIFNGLPCDCYIVMDQLESLPIITVTSLGSYTNRLKVKGVKKLTMSSIGTCGNFSQFPVSIVEKKSVSVVISTQKNVTVIESNLDNADKTDGSDPDITMHGMLSLHRMNLQDSKGTNITLRSKTSSMAAETYNLYVEGRKIHSFQLLLGGSYVLIVQENNTSVYVVVDPNSIHIFWIFPQTFILCVGEIYFLLTLTEFTYSQAPDSMKAIISSLRIISMAIGHFIVIFFTMFLSIEENLKYFMFSAFMMVDIVILIIFGRQFKPAMPDVKLI